MRFVRPLTYCLLGLLVVSAARSASGQSPSETNNTPPTVQTYRSNNFIVHSDISPEAAKELMDRLETMLSLISSYWGQRNQKPIECFVVEEFSRWPQGVIPNEAVPSIRGKAGVTLSKGISNGRQFIMNSRVFAVSDRGVPQHEAVHAYCSQTFGTAGPIWYAEGMAEMGQYWKKGDSSVNANPVVIKYLKKAPPKSLNEIINGGELSGDSWQNYAWRWALCHLLATNENYQKRFRPLGLALLQNKQTSFEDVYGSMSDEIIFEYLLFLKNMETGYRVDLCSWDWKARPRGFRGRLTMDSKIEARAGWQPTRATLNKGSEYEFTTAGTWSVIAEGDQINADGDEAGRGKLVGILFQDHQLSDEFDIGAYGKLTAPAEGHLFVRCRDSWGALSDNDGEIRFEIREAQPDSEPLVDPRK